MPSRWKSSRAACRMRSRGGTPASRFKRAMSFRAVDNACYRSVPSWYYPVTSSAIPRELAMRRTPLATLIASLLALALAACSPSNGSDKKGAGHPGMGMPAPEVSVVTVAPKTVPVSFEYVGQTAGSREVEVRARVTGILQKRNFDEGAPVKQGQSLFTIDPAPYRAAAARADADVG